MIIQMQRPTRLLAVLTATCLVYLCYTYLERLEFVSTCSERNVSGAFGTTRLLSARPATMPKRPTAKIAKVGVAVNALDIPVVHRAFKTHEVHNERHGYPHYIADREVVSNLIDNDRFRRGSGAYTKPAYLLAIIIAELLKPEDERLEWLFWFDGDTMVLNPSTPLEAYLPPKNTSKVFDEVNLIISANWDGLNSGAFAIRVHPWSASLLSGVLGYPMYERERTKKDRFRDQSAFQFLLGNQASPLAEDKLHHRNRWVEVPMRWFNSLPVNNAFYSDGRWLFSNNMTEAMFDNGTDVLFDDGQGPTVKKWKVMQGDFLVHFAGTKNVRDSWMGPWLDRAEALLPQWDNATYSSQLAADIRTWWFDYEVRAIRKYVTEPAKKEKEAKEKKEKEKKEKEKQEKEKQEKEKQEKEKQEKEKQEKEKKENEEKQQKEKDLKKDQEAETKESKSTDDAPTEKDKEAEAKALEDMAKEMATHTTTETKPTATA